MAAEAGDPEAQNKIGMLYGRRIRASIDQQTRNHLSSLSDERRQELAVEWYKKSAEQGYAEGQFRYAEASYEDPEVQVKYWTLAAEQGHPDAALGLGRVLLKEDSEGNYNKAVKWMEKAAEGGQLTAKSWTGSGHARTKGKPIRAWSRLQDPLPGFGIGRPSGDIKSLVYKSGCETAGCVDAEYILEIGFDRQKRVSQYSIEFMGNLSEVEITFNSTESKYPDSIINTAYGKTSTISYKRDKYGNVLSWNIDGKEFKSDWQRIPGIATNDYMVDYESIDGETRDTFREGYITKREVRGGKVLTSSGFQEDKDRYSEYKFKYTFSDEGYVLSEIETNKTNFKDTGSRQKKYDDRGNPLSEINTLFNSRPVRTQWEDYVFDSNGNWTSRKKCNTSNNETNCETHTQSLVYY